MKPAKNITWAVITGVNSGNSNHDEKSPASIAEENIKSAIEGLRISAQGQTLTGSLDWRNYQEWWGFEKTRLQMLDDAVVTSLRDSGVSEDVAKLLWALSTQDLELNKITA